MPRSDSYNTKQKDLIIDIIKSYKKEFMVKDIYEKLDKKVGLTTIYRLVDNLVSKGIITKSISKDGNTYYQYLEECNHDDHFFLKCEKCGNIFHVDCDCIEDLSSHIFNHHKFKVNHENIIIKGTCDTCERKS